MNIKENRNDCTPQKGWTMTYNKYACPPVSHLAGGSRRPGSTLRPRWLTFGLCRPNYLRSTSRFVWLKTLPCQCIQVSSNTEFSTLISCIDPWHFYYKKMLLILGQNLGPPDWWLMTLFCQCIWVSYNKEYFPDWYLSPFLAFLFRQNAFASGAEPWTPVGSLRCSWDPCSSEALHHQRLLSQTPTVFIRHWISRLEKVAQTNL